MARPPENHRAETFYRHTPFATRTHTGHRLTLIKVLPRPKQLAPIYDSSFIRVGIKPFCAVNVHQQSAATALPNWFGSGISLAAFSHMSVNRLA